MAFGDTLTPNAKLSLIFPTRVNWSDAANGNFKLLDAIIGTYFTVTNLRGIWTNSTAYTKGDSAVDTISSSIYTAAINNISSPAPTTFVQERTNHPTFWTPFSTAANNRGAWSGPGTVYGVNNFVVAGSKYAICLVSHTSTASFDADVASGKWSVLVDLSAVGSLVLPVLGGIGDANKLVTTNGVGGAYIINTMVTALGNGGATSLGLSILTSASQSAVRALLALGTSAVLDAGVSANNVIQLDSSAKIPALDASQVTSVIQEISIQSTAVDTTINTIPVDDSLPQSSEGKQFLGLPVFTPRKIGSRITINAVLNLSTNGAAGTSLVAALFDGTSSDAIAVGSVTSTTVSSLNQVTIQYTFFTVSLTPLAYSVRGGAGAGTTTFNGSGGSRFFGGALMSSLSITESIP